MTIDTVPTVASRSQLVASNIRSSRDTAPGNTLKKRESHCWPRDSIAEGGGRTPGARRGSCRTPSRRSTTPPAAACNFSASLYTPMISTRNMARSSYNPCKRQPSIQHQFAPIGHSESEDRAWLSVFNLVCILQRHPRPFCDPGTSDESGRAQTNSIATTEYIKHATSISCLRHRSTEMFSRSKARKAPHNWVVRNGLTMLRSRSPP